MWATIATAALGVVGILAATFGPAWREHQTERKRDVRAFRIARRRVAHELHVISVELESIATAGEEIEWPEGFEILVDAAWKEHEATLAELLADEELWGDLSVMYRRVLALRRIHTIEVSDGEPLDAEDVEVARKASTDAADAARRLVVARSL